MSDKRSRHPPPSCTQQVHDQAVPLHCSGCDGGDRPVYSMMWAATNGVPSGKDYPYPLPASTGICNPRVSKMKRAFTGGAAEVEMTSAQSLFKVCLPLLTHDLIIQAWLGS